MFVFSSLDQLQQKSKEISQFVNTPNLQKHETASQICLPDVYNESDKVIKCEFLSDLYVFTVLKGSNEYYRENEHTFSA